MQTRSQTIRQCLAEYQELLDAHRKVYEYTGLRMKAMYDFFVYIDRNFELIRLGVEKPYPEWWSYLKNAVIRCKQRLDDNNADLLKYLGETEREELTRVIRKMAKKY